MNIGWKIVDCHNHDFGTEGSLTVKGLYKYVFNHQNKVIVFVNVRINETTVLTAAPVIFSKDTNSLEHLMGYSGGSPEGDIVAAIGTNDLLSFSVVPRA